MFLESLIFTMLSKYRVLSLHLSGFRNSVLREWNRGTQSYSTHTLLVYRKCFFVALYSISFHSRNKFWKNFLHKPGYIYQQKYKLHKQIFRAYSNELHSQELLSLIKLGNQISKNLASLMRYKTFETLRLHVAAWKSARPESDPKKTRHKEKTQLISDFHSRPIRPCDFLDPSNKSEISRRIFITQNKVVFDIYSTTAVLCCWWYQSCCFAGGGGMIRRVIMPRGVNKDQGR